MPNIVVKISIMIVSSCFTITPKIHFSKHFQKIFFSNTVIKINMLHIVSQPENSTTVSYHYGGRELPIKKSHIFVS